MGLLAAAHEDDAFNSVVVLFESEDSQARGVADFYVADVFDAHRGAVGVADYDFADVFGVAQQAESANIVELLPDGIKAAAGVGVIGAERGDYLRYGDVEVVEAGGIEQNLILHGGAAEAGIVGYAGDAAVGAFDDPVLKGF